MFPNIRPVVFNNSRPEIGMSVIGYADIIDQNGDPGSIQVVWRSLKGIYIESAPCAVVMRADGGSDRLDKQHLVNTG